MFNDATDEPAAGATASPQHELRPAGSVVVLSGPVGAGKSTVARALIASAPGACAYIEGDAFWAFIAKPLQDEERGQRLRMIMRAMTASARHFERDGYEASNATRSRTKRATPRRSPHASAWAYTSARFA